MPQVSLPVVDHRADESGDLRAVLAERIEGEVRFSRHDRMLYATDASIYQVEPIGVVVPRSCEDVSAVVAACAEHGVAILPRGGGTSLAGQTVNAAVVIDFSPHCAELLEVSVADRRARVQPGLVLDHLNQALAPDGLMFGPDVATSTHATLGGMIGNNSAGARSILYGRTLEHVAGLAVVLADGTALRVHEGAADDDARVAGYTRRIADVVLGLERAIDDRFPRTRRRVNGYNLEYRRYVKLLPFVEGRPPSAVLYVEYFADDRAELDERLAALEGRYGADVVQRHTDPAAMVKAWKLRKAGEPLLHGQPGARKPVTFIEDTAVEPEKLPEFVRRFRAMVTAHGTTASYYAHASVGCLHIRPMIDLESARDLAHMREIVAEATDLVLEFGGALSGEHGDGRLRSHMLERFYGPEIVDGFRRIKAILDPAGLMNPGNITTAVPMTEALRVRPEQTPATVGAVDTYFRYDREHGFDGAITMCNGAGICRKTVGGTMCPSYRATRDERHATRGRGNALRLAVTGQIGSAPGPPGAAAWNDPETAATLDLCLSCKACKSECPSNVDIAKLKAEYTAQGYRAAGHVPLAARAFGHVRDLNRLGSMAPGLANGLARFGPVRGLIDRMLGLDPRRTLPEFSPSLFRWVRSRAAPAGDRPVVILFADCFTVYNESDIGRAAVETLEAFGYRVEVPDVGCCGRSRISNGLLEEAATTCAATARALDAHAGRTGAVAVVGCEPSCVSAITDDWLDLDMGVPTARLRGLAERTMGIEAFLETRWGEHPASPGFRPARSDAAPVLLHGHCHQKALGGADETLALLARLGVVQAIEAGCCGMAGAFGYTRSHYELSQQVAELALFPALRSAPDAVVAAPGTSCRHQIRDGLVRVARHPVELVHARIRPSQP